jgi:hypothetical protein
LSDEREHDNDVPDESHRDVDDVGSGAPDASNIRGYDILIGVWLAAATALAVLNVAEADVSWWVSIGLLIVVLALAPFMLRRTRGGK